jgi:hypothetical protein
MTNVNRIIMVFLIIIGIAVIYNAFTSIKIKTDVEKYENKIDSIQSKVDSVTLVNKVLDDKLSHVDESVATITNEIHHVDNNITVIKEKTNEKVISVDTFTNPQLTGFFSDRYK